MNMSGENDGRDIFHHYKNIERMIFFGRRGVEGAKEGAHIKCVTE